MASLREIRRKIKSVKSTQQITKAMKMVAAARLRRAQGRILAARPFAQKMEELVGHLVERLEEKETHPLFVRRDPPPSAPSPARHYGYGGRPPTTQWRTGEGIKGKRILFLVTSDKGLCGAFNTNLIRRALQYLREHGMDHVQLFVVGRKGRDYFKRIGARMVKDYTNIFNTLNFAHAELIVRDLLEVYEEDKSLSVVDMLYNEFKSVIQQKVVVKTLLPLTQPETRNPKPETFLWPDFLYEPSREQLLEALIPRFIKAQVFRVLLESSAAELGARMSAMENATQNATELLGSLTLTMNRTRQASITKEILEVVSGAEALK